MNKEGLFTPKQFGELPEIGATKVSVHNWIKAGLPHSTDADGDFFIDRAAGLDWVQRNRKIGGHGGDQTSKSVSRSAARRALVSASAVEEQIDALGGKTDKDPALKGIVYTVEALLKLDVTVVEHLKFIEEVLTKRVERLTLEKDLIDVSEARLAWNEAASAYYRGLKEATRIAASRVGVELRLLPDAVDLVKRAMEEAVDNALRRLGTGTLGGPPDVG